jgi:hypothetical protein
VPTGKPDGRADGAMEDVGVEGLSVSVLEPAPVFELGWLSAGWAPPVVAEGEVLRRRSVSEKNLFVKHGEGLPGCGFLLHPHC